jgi:hypothetical protein
VKGLREARASGQPATKAAKAKATKATKPKATRTRKPATPPANAEEVAKAKERGAEVDALPGPEMVQRVGDDDVQAALETANGSRPVAAPD